MRSENLVSRAFAIACSVMVAAVASGAIFAATVTTAPTTLALAAPETPATAAVPVRAPEERLERLLKREQLVLNHLEKRLTRAGEVTTRVGEYVDRQKSAGKDTSTLEEALAALRTAISSAQSSYDEAQRILEAKAGFDENGEVIDRTQAKTTVQTAGKAARECLLTLRKARHDVVRAIREYRKAELSVPQGR